MSTSPEQRIPADPQLSHVCDTIAELAVTYDISIGTAESLTAGNLAAMLGKAPSSGQWFRGGIVADHEDVKHTLLTVPDGPVVSERAAAAMAVSTASLIGADLTIAVTGEAGPHCQEDQPPGTVWAAVCDRGEVSTERKHFDGEPEQVLAQTLSFAIDSLVRHARERARDRAPGRE
ncbi:damage-inducible protein CinA [Rhodococcus sp. 14-2470-1b]|uniref:CinA family protein n=1 Tax=Rhodococcus sp. 14-2470-1b TaxID=2023149 RepID=UPI000B9B1A48|nr:nicotinamide-nucleotide amidohydrolase family protein [Rhodococcus sp. 14-2470-1b]OZF57687.1 damage-inducible protein CinA [Rhodococcus sp. 14-2470-1b]